MGGGNLQLKSQSAKISDNFPLGGVFCNWKITKYQEMPKFQWGGGYSATEKSKCQDFWQFSFSGGGGILYCRIGVNCRIWTKFSTTPAGSCITDSLSHTTYVETNQRPTPLFLCFVFFFRQNVIHHGDHNVFTIPIRLDDLGRSICSGERVNPWCPGHHCSFMYRPTTCLTVSHKRS